MTLSTLSLPRTAISGQAPLPRHQRSVELPGALRLAYCEQGDPDGTPVIALHGITDSQRSFEPLLPHLPRWLRWLAPSQRGHGDSARPAGGYRTRELAADVAAFMDALGIERAIVVGHSWGAQQALRFAIDHPSRTLGLVLAGAMPSFTRSAELVAFWRHDVAALADPVAPEFAREFQLGTAAQPLPPGWLEIAVAESLKVPARVWRAAFDGLMGEDLSAELPAVDAPTLLVWGRRDTICSAASQHALQTGLRHARLRVYDAAGHALHWEEPRRFAHDVVGFARRVRDGSSARALNARMAAAAGAAHAPAAPAQAAPR